MTLNDYLNKALKEGWAVAHFNISDAVTLAGICEAAKELGAPLMIGTSEGERKFIGSAQARVMINAYRDEYKLPIFLNADHHKSVSKAQEAVDADYDSIHIDLSVAKLEENIKGTKEVVAYVKSKNKDISVEGEVGYLVTESSKIYKEIIEIPPESLTKPEEAARFVQETGVDRFAPAVGNLHGIAANVKKLDIARIEAIRSLIGDTTMVLHGGSGTPDEQIKNAIEAGINNIHINTELRVAYADALRKFLNENPEETTPYKMFAPVIEAIKQKTAEKLKLFGSVNRI
ncbi:MAG: ketose-bisphosphate aldolase [bacterium]|nr:ketose-bisphosphate aldolase [bacterium]